MGSTNFDTSDMTYPPSSPPPAEPPPYTTRLVTARLPERGARVSYTLLVLTVLVFVAQMSSQTLLGQDIPALLGMKINRLIDAGQMWRLITPVLLHGSLIHLGFNMYALYVLGPGLERIYGPWRFLALYLLGAFGGNVLSYVLTPGPSLGSSTAIFGLLAAQGAFLYQHRGLFGARSRAALMNIVMVAVINFIIGLSPGIDNWGHLGGFVAGGLFAYLGGPQLALTYVMLTPRLQDVRPPARSLQAAAIVVLLFSLLAWIGGA
ncbi:MAG: rhomboid family intramembrane serine protease [Caldilineae bacterium]|nr:MAG: rhomboid family intramembrane serine protease [Caldilineae bacterium]